MGLRQWLASRLHRCQPPDIITIVPVLGRTWTCPCGATWQIDRWHEEERVYMGGADADIGSDYVGWVRQ